MAHRFKPCSVEGCNGNAHYSASGGRGMCQTHCRHSRKPLSEKWGACPRWIDAHKDYTGDDCLTWPFGRNAGGYAEGWYRGRRQIVGRVMCEAVNGPPPRSGLDAAHSCGKGADGCVNPRHLRWATRSENHMDKVQHGTSNRGVRNPNAKLTADDVRWIRKSSGSLSQSAIADILGVDQSNISHVLAGRSWRWLA